RFRAKAAKLDLEVFQFMLRSFVTIHDCEENPDLHPEGVTLETPDGRYLLEFHVEGAEMAALRAILGELFSDDAFGAVRMLEATRWEVPSELEETAFRFRSARLEDLGFPPLQQAVSLFAWRDHDSARWSRPTAPPGAALAIAERSVNFLEAAARELSPEEVASFQRELRAVSNEALVAEVQDPGDLWAVKRVGEMVRDYLSMALEHLTGGDPVLPAACLREVPTRTLFQVGFSLTLRLKFQVDRLAKEPLAKLDGSWLALPEQARALDALSRKRPLRALRVEGAEPVPFRSLRELDAARSAVKRAASQVPFFRAAMGGTEPAAREVLAGFGEPLETLGTERLLAALVAHAILDGVIRAAPVPAERVAALCDRLFEGTPSTPSIQAAAAERAASVLKGGTPSEIADEVGALVDGALEKLRTELGAAWLSERKLHPSLGEILPIDRVRAPASP
ncbi:MAG TPA: DUF6178 family protein, partial [Myxococcaceae bacterium]|nr:DUF6178 family protein [Myxococcaceae bacterium]